MKEKRCSKCGKVKPFSEYYKYNTGGNEITYWCKECIKQYQREHTSLRAN